MLSLICFLCYFHYDFVLFTHVPAENDEEAEGDGKEEVEEKEEEGNEKGAEDAVEKGTE